MKFAIVEDSKVINIVESESALQPNWIQVDKVNIGDEYNNGIFTPFEIVLTKEEKRKLVITSISELLNNVAQEHGYDNIISACTYAGYENPYQLESQRFIAWRGAVWSYAYQVESDVDNVIRPEPTLEELLAELPVFSE